jgi:hypothetical protein
MDKEFKVQLKVNVINQLLLYRKSTFKDRCTFLDEDIQNAQRAKSKTVKISMDKENKTVTLWNDGKPLEDPQALFSIAESGWDSDTVESENPFGMGFFSNISVSELIEIKSGKYHIIFDVDKIIQTNNPEAIEVSLLDVPVEDFTLILHKFDFSTIHDWQIRERALQLGKYVHELDIYIGNELCPKMSLENGDGHSDNLVIDDGEIKGWFRFTHSWESRLGVFYRGRHIKNLDFMGIIGDVHVTDKTLNLTAPDRKNIVEDEKYVEFISLLKVYIQEYCLNVIASKPQNYVDTYSSSLKYYASGDLFFNSFRFMMVKSKDDYTYVEKLLKIKKERSYLRTFSELEAYLKIDQPYIKEDVDYLEYESEPVGPAQPKGVFAEKSPSYSGSTYTSGRPASTIEKVYKDDLHLLTGDRLLSESGIKFWVDVSGLAEYEEQVNIAHHYGITLIVCRNSVEASLWEEKEEQGKAFHISKLKDQVSIVSELFNTDLNVREQRAAMLFGMVSRMCGFERNIFIIGDLKSKRVLELEELDFRDEVEIQDLMFALDSKSSMIYVDRKIIRSSKLRSDMSTIIALNDYKFIMKYIREICDSLSELLRQDSLALMTDLIRALAENPWF